MLNLLHVLAFQGKLFSDTESIQARAEAAMLLKQLDFPVCTGFPFVIIYFPHAIVLWKQGVHFVVLLLDSSYAYILSFPYYHVIVRHGVHIMTNVPIFWQVDSLKAKLFEKLEQSLQDVHLNTEDIINVLEDSNDTSNPTTANDVSRRKNYCF